MIDTPRWEWRGRLWAHLISDESIDELHRCARALGLPWLSFGLDHYDVPDTLWPTACGVAELVDSREIVRSLRRSGLRVPGGKPQKAWRPVERLPADATSPDVQRWLAQARALLVDPMIETLVRPGQYIVLHMVNRPVRPELGRLQLPPVPGARVIETVSETRYSLELVLETTAGAVPDVVSPGGSRSSPRDRDR